MSADAAVRPGLTGTGPAGTGAANTGAANTGTRKGDTGPGASGRPAPLRRAARLLLRAAELLWLPVLLFAGWEVGARLWESPFVPPASEIAAHAGEIWFSGDAGSLFLSDLFTRHVPTSLSRGAQGWLAAVVVGVLGGLVLGQSRWLREMFGPVLRFGMSVPTSALLPLALTLFGITDQMNTSLIAFGCLWTVLVNTMDGVSTLDRTMVMTARSMRIRGWRYQLRFVLPAASPQIFAGLRVSLGLAFILMVFGELFAATRGIGHFVSAADRQFRYLDMWAGIALIAVLGLLVNGLYSLAEGRLLRWHRGMRRHTSQAG